MRVGELTGNRLGLSRDIIGKVIALHKIHADDFFGYSREPHLVAARREAARRMNVAGFSVSQISVRLKRDYSTILNYLPKFEETKKARRGRRLVTRHLTDAAHDHVMKSAKAAGIAPDVLIAQWVEERAQFEMQRKARAA